MNGYLQPIAAVVVMASALTSAPVHAKDWEGTWKTTFGDIALVQEGDFIYGDYRGGTVQGIVDRPTRTVRGVFRNPDGSVGLMEWRMDPSKGFVGAWDWVSQNVPRHNAGASDRKWTGSQRIYSRPNVRNFAQTPSRSSFITGSPKEYKDWIRNFARTNPLAGKYPKLVDYPFDFVPTAVEIDIRELSFETGIINDVNWQSFKADVYGRYGIYMYCETRNQSRPIPPLYGKTNQVFNKPRDGAVKVGFTTSGVVVDANQGIRRFALESECANDPGARFLIQIQTNLNERNLIAARDTKFGYQSYSFYLDQLPSSSIDNFVLRTTNTDLVMYTGKLDSISDVSIFTNLKKGRAKGSSVRGHVRFIR